MYYYYLFYQTAALVDLGQVDFGFAGVVVVAFAAAVDSDVAADGSVDYFVYRFDCCFELRFAQEMIPHQGPQENHLAQLAQE